MPKIFSTVGTGDNYAIAIFFRGLASIFEEGFQQQYRVTKSMGLGAQPSATEQFSIP